MNISIVTPDGELYNEEVTSVIVSSDANGSYEILRDHLPIVSTIDTGYVKLTNNDITVYVVIVNGVLENHYNQITVIAQDAYVGKSKEKAFENLESIRQTRIEDNKKRNIELMKAEQELMEQIRKSKAGSNK